ncbi:MAG: phycobilisome rod-core linker polypeptide [Thermosynechococcaceae cyanobacterium]
MAIPALNYAPSSRNHRVANFEVPGDEHSWIFSTDNLLSGSDMDVLIHAAYRQIFNEQQMLACHRQTVLESQLRSGQISVRDFIRGLALSDSFRRLNYEANNNYRFVKMCIQRILGRDVYSDRETIAWSIVIGTEGLVGFIDALVNSEEYAEAFGENIVPYQRRRILPQRTQGEQPFARMPRYGDVHLAQLQELGHDFSRVGMVTRYVGLPPAQLRLLGAGLAYGLGGFFTLIALAVILSWFGLLSL